MEACAVCHGYTHIYTIVVVCSECYCSITNYIHLWINNIHIWIHAFEGTAQTVKETFLVDWTLCIKHYKLNPSQVQQQHSVNMPSYFNNSIR